jgi:hypothetical protein
MGQPWITERIQTIFNSFLRTNGSHKQKCRGLDGGTPTSLKKPRVNPVFHNLNRHRMTKALDFFLSPLAFHGYPTSPSQAVDLQEGLKIDPRMMEAVSDQVSMDSLHG